MTVSDECRKEYKKSHLSRGQLDSSPVKQFDKWFKELLEVRSKDANAMSLATVSDTGQPAVRMVLLKDYSNEGFVFYSNSSSTKGRHMAANPKVAIGFYWPELERQVRIQGEVTLQSEELTEEYFKDRPRGAQIAAHCSRQSEFLQSRTLLEKAVEHLEKDFAGKEISKPENWVGYVVKPDSFEFWQGREDRLHDRFIYLTEESGSWTFQRLYP